MGGPARTQLVPGTAAAYRSPERMECPAVDINRILAAGAEKCQFFGRAVIAVVYKKSRD
ncbi:hypothetical protein ACFL5U_03360 [Candidatus Margulisiibacteriota bacterium]